MALRPKDNSITPNYSFGVSHQFPLLMSGVPQIHSICVLQVTALSVHRNCDKRSKHAPPFAPRLDAPLALTEQFQYALPALLGKGPLFHLSAGCVTDVGKSAHLQPQPALLNQPQVKVSIQRYLHQIFVVFLLELYLPCGAGFNSAFNSMQKNAL